MIVYVDRRNADGGMRVQGHEKRVGKRGIGAAADKRCLPIAKSTRRDEADVTRAIRCQHLKLELLGRYVWGAKP
ncbi:MAG: hypothetical protein M0P95_17980 [Sulfuritalea sp.]|jgi:hypothetical protein|nr:hypothetical protein [Sulfuritalea sp.]